MPFEAGCAAVCQTARTPQVSPKKCGAPADPSASDRPPLDRRWKVTGGNWVSSGREYVYPDNLWTPFAPRLEVVEVPGDHDSMVLEPNVRVLAARMKAAIQAAEAGELRHPDHRLAAE